MSFKCNPWLGSDDAESEHESEISNIDLFIFSGEMETAPGLFHHPEEAARKK